MLHKELRLKYNLSDIETTELLTNKLIQCWEQNNRTFSSRRGRSSLWAPWSSLWPLSRVENVLYSVPLPLAQSVGNTEKSLVISSFPHTTRLLYTLMRPPPKAALLQAEQWQLLQPLLIWQMLQCLNHLCGPCCNISSLFLAIQFMLQAQCQKFNYLIQFFIKLKHLCQT